ncbi:MAG: hypothetical protein ACOYOP_09435 [Microthrixaceae bacterium]
MGALVVGLVLVVVASVALGAAMFGRRPVPQPATGRAAGGRGAVTAPSSNGRNGRAAANRMTVTIPTKVKVRSGLLLLLTVLVIAALVGVALSIVTVLGGLVVA